MASPSALAHSAEVDEHTFDTLVIEKSRSVPVLVDFWAEWCGPCRVLMPLLAKLADDYQGKFFLAKVNTDVEQRLAGRFGIRSLPTVKLFKNGEVVGEFLGAQPERAVRELLDRHIPRASDALLDEAVVAYTSGQMDAALARLRQALEEDPKNDRARLHLARILYERGERAEADELIARVSAQTRAEPEAAATLARLEFLRIAAGAPAEDELADRLARSPDESEARYQLAAWLILREEHEAAMRHLLELVSRDRQFGDDAGRKALLTVFNLLGGKSDLVRKYRSLLSTALH